MDERPCYFFSTKAERPYTEISFEPDARLIFGSESEGIPSFYHEKYVKQFSNSAAIVLYEALRQQGFQSLMDSKSLSDHLT